MYGSIVIDSPDRCALLEFKSGPFSTQQTKLLRGSHVQSDYKGMWISEILTQDESDRTLLLPQRNMQLLVDIPHAYQSSHSLLNSIKHQLQTLDVEFEAREGSGSNYQTKLTFLADDLPCPVQINNNTEHGFFALIAADQPIYLYGLCSLVNSSVQLAWCDSDNPPLDSLVRAAFPLQYAIYRFPPIKRQAVLLHTRALCSKWWMLKKHESQFSILRAFNAIEARLFKR